jgi:hypothetical protein
LRFREAVLRLIQMSKVKKAPVSRTGKKGIDPIDDVAGDRGG